MDLDVIKAECALIAVDPERALFLKQYGVGGRETWRKP
jgi:hypothetical protein